MKRKTFNRIKRLIKLVEINFAIIVSFIQFESLCLPTIAFASDDLQFNLSVPKNQDSFTVVSDYINQRIPAIQALSAVLLIIATIGCGTKLGVASAFGDSRGRQEMLMAIFWIIIAGAIVVNAKQIVGISARAK